MCCIHCGAAAWRALPHALHDMMREGLATWDQLVHALHVLLALSVEHLDPDSMGRLARVGLARAVMDAAPTPGAQEVETWLAPADLARHARQWECLVVRPGVATRPLPTEPGDPA